RAPGELCPSARRGLAAKRGRLSRTFCMPASTSSSLNHAYRKAQRYLCRCEPAFKPLIARVGPCTLEPQSDSFRLLVRAIVSQMISTKAAASIFAKLEARLGRKKLSPTAILTLDETALREVGLSSAKARSLHDLAGRVTS